MNITIIDNPADYIPRDELLELAGDCVKCRHYDQEKAVFTMECYSCSRFHGDQFESREDTE